MTARLGLICALIAATGWLVCLGIALRVLLGGGL